jgi:hypothetical protein
MIPIHKIERELAEIGVLQAAVKSFSMVYQGRLKLIVADHYGLSFAEVNLPFAEWMALRHKYELETGNRLL